MAEQTNKTATTKTPKSVLMTKFDEVHAKVNSLVKGNFFLKGEAGVLITDIVDFIKRVVVSTDSLDVRLKALESKASDDQVAQG